MNLDIPTFFNRPSNIDQGLSSDLSRLGSAVEQIWTSDELVRVEETALASGDATLQIGFTLRLKPPQTGTVTLRLPAPADGTLDNSEASLVITDRTAATIYVMAPRGATVNGATQLTLIAAPYWYRFKWHGGNWYRG